MPSLHVGWALLMAIAIIGVAKTKWRWLALLHPAATWFVVVVTANHYWLDGLVGCLLIIGSIALTMLIAWTRARWPMPADTAPRVPGTSHAFDRELHRPALHRPALGDGQEAERAPARDSAANTPNGSHPTTRTQVS